jgi:hypothetical protein
MNRDRFEGKPACGEFTSLFAMKPRSMGEPERLYPFISDGELGIKGLFC